jgi:protein phosphatase
VRRLKGPNSEFMEQLVEEAAKVNVGDFIQITENVANALQSEDGNFGDLEISGRMIRVPPVGRAIVVGDLHGDLESLNFILKESGFFRSLRRKENVSLIFLGDYGDRGEQSAEVYYVVLKLKVEFPKNVILMRGNHEGPDDLLASPHDLPFQLRSRFGEEWSQSYLKLKELFSQLYVAVIVDGKYVFLHGGVPSQAKSLEDLAYAHLKHPQESYLEEILWSDPEEGIKGTLPSPRGAGKLFGEDVTKKFLEMLDVSLLVRGHEPAAEGFKINHNGRILTLFSRKGEPYFNEKAAYLDFELNTNFRDVFELRPFVRTF